MKQPTILVIDDDSDLADLVRRALEKEGFDVILAPDGATGLRIARQHRPDLIVLDVTMPGMDGLEVCKLLRAEPRHAELPIIVLSGRASTDDRVAGLELGADDYMVKPFVARELVARVHAVLRRSSSHKSAPSLVHAGDLSIDVHKHRATLVGRELTLTAAEFRVLELLASHPDRVFSRDEVIELALQSQADVTQRTVDTHIVGLRRALGLAEDMIETVRGVGYRFRGEPNIGKPH